MDKNVQSIGMEKETPRKEWSALWKSEDWWACWFGFLMFFLVFIGLIDVVPKPEVWTINPFEAFSEDTFFFFIILMFGLMGMLSIGIKMMGEKPKVFFSAFIMVFLLSFLALLIAKQETIKSYGFEYVLWALLIGMIIRNVFGLPDWLKTAAKTELYIKTGLVLLGAEILFNTILNLGVQGLTLAWGVTPLILYTMYVYGTRKLKLDKKLTIIIAAATSVCGVSAAIAVAAATRAKKELLTLAISLSLMATVIMLVGMPALVKTLGIDYLVGGAWIGGTVDSTGAVVAAGELLSQEAMKVAAVVKLIQNVLIAVIAFVIAFIWVTKIEREEGSKPKFIDVWYRFPKFVIGFVALSLITSFLLIPLIGELSMNELLKVSGSLRSYFFSLAFVSIGLNTRLRELRNHAGGAKSFQLYFFGQLFNIILTFVFAWLLFSSI